jgi:(p)ppGpp synthase/HD superfamily hydrolase
LPASLHALVEGQREAERVWTLYAEKGAGVAPEGLRRLLLAIIRDLRVIFILLARQLVRLRNALPACRNTNSARWRNSPPTSMRRSRTGSASGN